MDDEDAHALRAEGLDPDAPAVVVTIELVGWELSLKPCLTIRSETGGPWIRRNGVVADSGLAYQVFGDGPVELVNASARSIARRSRMLASRSGFER